MKSLSGVRKVLVASLVAYLVADFLLTPLAGLETRDPAGVTTVGRVGLGLLFLGLALAIVALVLLFRGSRRSTITALLAAALYFPAFLTEVTGTFSKFHPPTAISWVEWIQAVIAVVTIVLALRAREVG